MEKYYFTYNQIHNTVQQVAERIIASGFNPDYLLAIGTGGFIPARMLKTYIERPIITVGLVSYDDTTQTNNSGIKKVQWLDGITDIKGKRILIVDEVDDTRATLQYCVEEILHHEPAEISLFVVHNKLKPKKGIYPQEVSHIFVGENLEDKWIYYPWDAKDINAHEQQTRQ